MKRSVSILIAGAALATLSPALADSGSPQEPHVLVETSTAFHIIDVPAAEADGQAGDIIAFESSLSDDGRAVGSLAGHCVQLRADGTLDNCDVTVTLGDNSFRMSGLFDPAAGGVLTITGGTGSWVGAGGIDAIVNQPDGTAVHTIEVARPQPRSAASRMKPACER